MLRSIAMPTKRRAVDPSRQIVVEGARANNLQDVTVAFPIGVFVGVTGVSGSGKSSLVNDVLYKVLANQLNGARQDLKAEKGYVRLSRTWKSGDVVELDLPMPVERVHAHPKVKANAGRVALQRGPVVYCLEGVDNAGMVRNLCLPPQAKLSAAFRKDLTPTRAFSD